MNPTTKAAAVSTDFGRVIDQDLRSRPDRGDERHAHISDLFGCDLATWARRKGLPQLPFEPRTLVKFEMGRSVEDAVSRAIREHYPGDSERNVRIAWNPNADTCREIAEDEEPADGEMVGHIDIELLDDDALIEVKSTVFFHGKEPAEPEGHYVEQASGYATARGRERFAIVVVCRSTGNVKTWWFNTADFAMDSETRAIEVLQNTNPLSDIAPKAAPRTSWACKTCRYAACSLNKNLVKEAAYD